MRIYRLKKILLTLIVILGSLVGLLGQGTDYFSIAKNKTAYFHPKRRDYVIVIDYRKSIVEKRLCLVDMKSGKNILESRVAHAFKSGVMFPTKFSNQLGSNTSSKGVFITGKTTISPKFGYAMLIDGLEKGVNNNARKREIIFHSDKNMQTKWSYGCFATPEEINKKLIDLTKNGCLVVVLD
jgi:hypothetical protein